MAADGMKDVEGGIIEDLHRTITVRNEEVLGRVSHAESCMVRLEFLAVFLEDGGCRHSGDGS